MRDPAGELRPQTRIVRSLRHCVRILQARPYVTWVMSPIKLSPRRRRDEQYNRLTQHYIYKNVEKPESSRRSEIKDT